MIVLLYRGPHVTCRLRCHGSAALLALQASIQSHLLSEHGCLGSLNFLHVAVLYRGVSVARNAACTSCNHISRTPLDIHSRATDSLGIEVLNGRQTGTLSAEEARIHCVRRCLSNGLFVVVNFCFYTVICGRLNCAHLVRRFEVDQRATILIQRRPFEDSDFRKLMAALFAITGVRTVIQLFLQALQPPGNFS